MNVTLTLDHEIVRKIRKIAAERDTTLTGLVRDYLNQLARNDESADREARNLANLERAFNLFSVDASPRNWTRSELYDRHSA